MSTSSRGTAGTVASGDPIRVPVLPPLIPPFRFACVEEGIYRGACPSLRNLRYLTRLNLRAVISLLPPSSICVPNNGNIPDMPVKDLSEFCELTHTRHFTHVLDKYDDGFSHTPELVARVLAQLLDKDNHPVFIHCTDGRNNTGLAIMCLRKVQNWDSQAILDEFSRYTKDNNFEYNEHMFVKNFNHPIAAPRSIPIWLRNRIHPPSNSPIATTNSNSNNHSNHPANAPLITPPDDTKPHISNATVAGIIPVPSGATPNAH